MKHEIAVAQLSIVDGAWQESPDNVARFPESSLFPGASERGSLFVVAEVTGDPQGRDALARELVETTRRDYAASRGSIMLGLAQAVRAANDVLYDSNAKAAREARRVAGMTAAILRDGELFLAQAGPGLACLIHGTSLVRFPEESPWFDPNEDAIGEMMDSRSFPSEGAVPLGMRHIYNPDQFHLTLQPGDIVLIATRTLVHLLSNEELLDTAAHHHPDEIIASLEDLAGTLDVSVIALRVEEDGARLAVSPTAAAAELPQVPAALPGALATPEAPALAAPRSEPDEEHTELELPPAPPPAAEPVRATRGGRAREQTRPASESDVQSETTRRVDLSWLRAASLRVTAGVVAIVASVFSVVDWKSVSRSVDRAVSNVSRRVVRATLFLLHNILPGEPYEGRTGRVSAPAREAGWRLLALLFPVVLVAAGGWMWATTRAERQRVQAAQVTDLVAQANAAIDSGRALASTDKDAARKSLQHAIDLTDQAKVLAPNSPTIRTVYYQAQDELDTLNGISVLLYLPSFATFSDPKAEPSRIVTHSPDVYILDRGTARVYHYLVNDAGPTVTPVPSDGVILKEGDKAGDHTVGTLVDLLWVDPGGRLIAVDKTGAFLEYDASKSTWATHMVKDAAQWGRITSAATYAGNLYLLDAGNNQILKYVAADGAWTSSVTFFAPGVSVDLTTATDIAIDGDIWLARSNGSLARFSQGRPNDLAIQDLDVPITSTVAVYTMQSMAGVYVADAVNCRIVQIDKTTGRFMRQFKPSSQYRSSFDALQALAVDESNKEFLFTNGNQAFLATIPQ